LYSVFVLFVYQNIPLLLIQILSIDDNTLLDLNQP